MSTWLELTITGGQRVSLGTGGERAFLTRSHPVIPGSVVRGALAGAWLAAGGSPNDRSFHSAFERGRFSSAVPEGVQLRPQSVEVCKYHDAAADHLPNHDLAFGPNPLARMQCGGQQALKGDYTRAPHVTVTTTAMQPGKHVAKEGSLFSREALEKGTIFRGLAVVEDDAVADTLETLTTIFVGGRSGVMGRCQLSIAKLDGPPHLASGSDVVLCTRSATILVDDAGMPCLDLAGTLQEKGFAVADLWADRFESNAAGGWHVASGLPKPTEVVICPGAVVKLTGCSPEALRTLLDEGIGLRRSEGYGWLDVVPKAWAPLAQTTTRTSGPADDSESETFGQRVAELQLTHAQAQWLAQILQRRHTGYHLTADDWKEPSVARVSAHQRAKLIEIVRDTPERQRNSLAFAITKGARR